MKLRGGRRTLVILGILATLFILLKPPIDPDLGWHLRLGEFILDRGQFPWQDTFSYTMTGHRVADFYWLSEVVMVFLRRTVGYFGLSLVCAFVAALAVGFSSNFDPFVSFLVTLWLIPSTGVRPFNFGLLFFSSLWLLLRRRKFCWLPLLFLIWANFYANFVFGLILTFLFFGLEALRKRKLSLKTATIPLLSVVATLVNPYGTFLWQTLLAEANSLLMRNTIAEWLPPNPHTDFGLFFFIFLFFIAFLVIMRSKKLNITEVGLIATFALMGIFSLYYIPLFAIVVGPFLLRELKSLAHLPIFNDQMRWGIKIYASAFLAVFALIVGPFVQVPKVWSQSRDPKVLAEAGEYPYEAVEFLRENPQKGNIFNDYVWGGYLIWQLPSVKTFIDGRMPAWREGDKYIFEDYLTVMRLKPGWEEVLEKYEISYFLIHRDSALAQALKVHPAWKIIYEDELAVIFAK